MGFILLSRSTRPEGRMPRRIYAWNYPNRPESSGTRTTPIKATPPPAINCFMPCDFAYV